MNPAHLLIAAPTGHELKSLESCLHKLGLTNTLVTGVGPGATAHRLTMALSHGERPAVVVLAGIGGAYPKSGLEVGNVCIASSEIYGDLGRCTGAGVESIILSGGEVIATWFDLIPAWQGIIKAEELENTGVCSAAMATVSCSSASMERADAIASHTGALVENIEGAAAAQSCLSFDIPLLEIRAISNVAGEPDRGKWDMKVAMENLGKAIRKIIITVIAA